MTTITLPADLEARLSEEASRRGVTVEELALERLADAYPKPRECEELPPGATMYDYLKDYIGVLDGPSDMSRDISRKFADHLEEDYERQKKDFLRRKGEL